MISLKLAATLLAAAGLPHATVSHCWSRSHDATSCQYSVPASDLGIEAEGWVWKARPATFIRGKRDYRVHTPGVRPEWATVSK